jgi:LAS superfamily LD-carboxypeptidase LdcB
MAENLKYNTEKFTSCLNTFREIFSLPEIDNHQGSVILPLDFSLEMDGISGLIPHSSFEIPTNSLPSNYIVKNGNDKGKSKIAFILHTIDHNFNNNKWTTKIAGQTLNIRFDELTEEQKQKLKPKNKPNLPPSETKSNIKSTGSKKNIEGITYKNGEIPTNKLRPILNESKYNNPSVNKSDGSRVRLFEDASLSLDRLLIAAEHANIKLKINSAYRTYDDQLRVWNTNCSNAVGTGKCIPKKGKNLTAIPGTSNHGYGLAIDFAIANGKLISENNIEYKWLIQNASRFGFKRIASEAWHWEYQIS